MVADIGGIGPTELVILGAVVGVVFVGSLVALMVALVLMVWWRRPE